MRVIRSIVNAGAAAGLLAITLMFVAPLAMAVGPDTDQSIRQGKMVAVTGTTVEVKEWAGIYTYRLSPTGRQALDAAQIRPGDEVRFSVYSPWGVAYDFGKMRADSSSAAMSQLRAGARTDPKAGGHAPAQSHIAISPDSGQVIGG